MQIRWSMVLVGLFLGLSSCASGWNVECVHWVDSLTGKAHKHPQCESATPSRN